MARPQHDAVLNSTIPEGGYGRTLTRSACAALHGHPTGISYPPPGVSLQTQQAGTRIRELHNLPGHLTMLILQKGENR